MQWSSAACSEEVDPMLTRRRFLETMLAAGAGIPALKDDGLERLLGLARRVDGRLPADVARDEDFWLGIQQAFTLDRTLINLNNGGVSPSPRVVQEAMRRSLEYSNTAPVYTMWQVLEPEIEIAPHRLLHDPRRWAHAPVVEIDQRAVERERLLDPEPEVLVSSDVRGQAAVHPSR